MSCFACFFRLLLLVALIKNQFGRYLLVQVEETKKIDTPQVIPQIEVDEEKKIDIPQVIPQVEVEEENFLNNTMESNCVVSIVIHEKLYTVETHAIVQNMLLELFS